MTKAEKEIDNLLKNSYHLTKEEKEKYKKEKLTDEEIKKLEAMMTSSSSLEDTESDIVVED